MAGTIPVSKEQLGDSAFNMTEHCDPTTPRIHPTPEASRRVRVEELRETIERAQTELEEIEANFVDYENEPEDEPDLCPDCGRTLKYGAHMACY
jgi:hypothetical protein